MSLRAPRRDRLDSSNLLKVVWAMRRVTQDLAPTVAAKRAMTALLEAAMYSGIGIGTAGRRLRHRTAAAGMESARRAGGALFLLRGGKPPQRRNTGRFLVAATAGGTAGAAAAWGIRHGMDLRRTSVPANGSTPRVP
jgi:hypothetical protein